MPNFIEATDEKLKIAACAARRELARRYYQDYVEYVHRGNYHHYRHTKMICDELQPIADGEQRYIMIEMPPRHGKSMTVTETFPSFFVTKNQDKRVIVASYSDSLARKFGRRNRDKVVEYGPKLFDVRMSAANSASNNWSLEGHRGGMIATGIGGSITGEGADCLIIDDPFKNAEEANSKTIRDKVWDEWESTLSTRLHKGASVIVIMTRWHEDDIIGRLLEQSPRDWIRLRLPAIAEDADDLLNRKPGEALCSELGFDEEWAKTKKKEVGSRTWAALFQQRPSPASGNVFQRHWWKFYVRTQEQLADIADAKGVILLPKLFDKLAQSWDCTFKDTDESDFVVGQVWSKKKADFFLFDQDRGHKNFPTTVNAIRAMTDKWPKARGKYIEDKANGSAVIQTLQHEISGIIPVEPYGGKEARANAVSPVIEAGNVYLPHPSIAPWVNDFIEECTVFPNGAHDDQVDAMTQALNQLMGSKSNALDRARKLYGRR